MSQRPQSSFAKKGRAVGMLGLIEMLLLLGEKGAKTIKKEQIN
jgi:hypothetical protein